MRENTNEKALMKNALMKNALMSSDETLVKVKYPCQIALCESFRCLRGRECLFLTITPLPARAAGASGLVYLHGARPTQTERLRALH